MICVLQNNENKKGEDTEMNRRRTMILMLAVMLFAACTPLESFAAAAVTTKTSTLSKNTFTDRYTVTVNSANGTRDYNIFSQEASNLSKKSFIAQHGCAVSALTCVLSGYNSKYADWTPSKVSKQLEKQVFGAKAWNANYKKSLPAQRPVSLYGISKILSYCKIQNKYVRTFKDKQAVKDIKQHLKTGNAVIIEVNNHKQVNGKISAKYDNRWATSKHTMALLGMTDTGKVIVADSANREWSGQKQRVKFAKMEDLIRYMIPCKKYSNSLYFNSVDSCGGYILVNKK